MCGRFALYNYLREFEEEFGVDVSNFDFTSYNISPDMSVPVIVRSGSEFEVQMMRWGIDIEVGNEKRKIKIINCRSESADRKKVFKDSIRQRVCVVPANGYYEWKKGVEKLPYYMSLKKSLLYFAAIYFNNGRFVILTRDSMGKLENIHHRMPLLLGKSGVYHWLDKNSTYQIKLSTILREKIHEKLTIKRVSNYVNSPINDGKRCIEEIVEEIQQELLL